MGFHDPQLNFTSKRGRRSKGKALFSRARNLVPLPFRTAATQAKISRLFSALDSTTLQVIPWTNEFWLRKASLIAEAVIYKA